MRFNKYIAPEIKELLESQYREYIKNTPMTKKEQRALREWVKNGNSVYENPSGAWYEGQTPIEFLIIYREDEYIRQQTKGMSSEEARRFALNYYGWDDEKDLQNSTMPMPVPVSDDSSSAELPFN